MAPLPKGGWLRSRLGDCDGSMLSTPLGNCVTHLPLHRGGMAKHPSPNGATLFTEEGL